MANSPIAGIKEGVIGETANLEEWLMSYATAA